MDAGIKLQIKVEHHPGARAEMWKEVVGALEVDGLP